MRSKEAGSVLYARFSSIWGRRFTEQFDDELAVKVWIEEWGTMVCSHGRPVVRKAIDICKMSLDWPPVMSEFLKICREAAGEPDFESAFQMAIRRDFSFPLVEQAFKRLDSWKFRHATEKESRSMFSDALELCLKERQSNLLGYSGTKIEALDFIDPY